MPVVKLLFLLYLINFLPPFLAYALDRRFAAPLDGGRLMRDGRPVLGPHKTWRGVLGAVLLGGGLGGAILGFPLWLGLALGALSMLGDLASSFVKRRLGQPSGRDVPGLDQLVEGALPLALAAPVLGLSWGLFWALLLAFGLGAYAGSWFYKVWLLRAPFDGYPRRLSPRVRAKEIASCQGLPALRYLLNFEEAFYYHFLISNLFRLLGLHERGRKNALALVKTEVTLAFPDLPPAFDGYRLLLLADLHLDGLPELADVLRRLLAGERFDLCLLGGDYRMRTYGPFQAGMDLLRPVVRDLRAEQGCHAVLGNHDCLEILPLLEEMGARPLVNDNVVLERDGQRLWLAGVDDPHYYRCESVEVACQGAPAGAFIILLAHSPEAYAEAAERGVSLYLCGHTHAGQIQIPGVGPVFTHSRSPRRLCQGAWRHGAMQGYTSAGVGASGAPVRFFSQGEAVILTLRREEWATGAAPPPAGVPSSSAEAEPSPVETVER